MNGDGVDWYNLEDRLRCYANDFVKDMVVRRLAFRCVCGRGDTSKPASELALVAPDLPLSTDASGGSTPCVEPMESPALPATSLSLAVDCKELGAGPYAAGSNSGAGDGSLTDVDLAHDDTCTCAARGSEAERDERACAFARLVRDPVRRKSTRVTAPTWLVGYRSCYCVSRSIMLSSKHCTRRWLVVH